MTDTARPVLLHNCADVALILDRPYSATPAELTEEVRTQLRAWAEIHAHYFGPLVVDRAAERMATEGLPAAGMGRLIVSRTTAMAWLHLAARS